jgi:hypothetical protein
MAVINFARPPELCSCQFNADKGRGVPPLSYETCTSVVTTQYPPIIIKVMNEAARALTSMR